MDELQRSEETERELVREAVKRIRAREQALRKKCDLQKYITPWDSDELKMKLGTAMLPLVGTRYDTDVVLTTTRRNPDGKRLYILMDQVVDLQFIPPEHLKTIFLTREIFEYDGGIRLSEFSSPGLDGIRKFCEKMDQVIVEESLKLRDQGVKNIFEAMYLEIGGDAIFEAQNDRVGKRIRYLWDLACRYKVDKERWRKEMVRLRLLK